VPNTKAVPFILDRSGEHAFSSTACCAAKRLGPRRDEFCERECKTLESRACESAPNGPGPRLVCIGRARIERLVDEVVLAKPSFKRNELARRLLEVEGIDR